MDIEGANSPNGIMKRVICVGLHIRKPRASIDAYAWYTSFVGDKFVIRENAHVAMQILSIVDHN